MCNVLQSFFSILSSDTVTSNLLAHALTSFDFSKKISKSELYVPSINIMAPSKRSSSPSQPPAWFRELQQAIRDQELAIRELRIVTMENQQVLQSIRNELNRSPIIVQSRHTASSSTSQSSTISQPIVQFAAPLPRVANNSVRQRAAARPVQPSAAIIAHNEAVRQSAVRLPRVAQATTHLNRICWFHRQFGRASVNCLPPCSFMDMEPNLEKAKKSQQVPQGADYIAHQSTPAPNVENPAQQLVQKTKITADQSPLSTDNISNQPVQPEIAPTSYVNSVILRIPLERQGKVSKRSTPDSNSSSESSEMQPPKNFKGTNPDWNELAPDLSSSSSSSSSSESEEETAK